MSRLFFFTEFYHPAQNTTGYYLTKIIHTAARCLNMPVSVCCAVPPNDGETSTVPNLTVKHITTGQYDKNRLLQRFAKYVVISLKFAAYAAFNVKKDDIVFAVTNPAFLVLFLAVLKKLKAFRYTLLVYDVFPENLVPAGLTRRNSLAYRAVIKCFDWAYRNADELIVIGRDMEEIVCSKVNNANRITRIPNWADVESIRPEPRAENELICAYGLQNKTVFLFAGNLGRVQGIENLLRAIALARSESASYLFVGDGALCPEIGRFIRENPHKSVMHLGRFPLSSQKTFLNACDVAFVTLDDAMYGLGVPSKSYFAMAAGKPLLLVADAKSEIGRVIFEEDIGWVVPPNRPVELAAKIDEICALDILAERGRRARKVAERRFSEQVVLSQYADYFRSLVDRKDDRGQTEVRRDRQRANDMPVQSPIYVRGKTRPLPETSTARSVAGS